MKYRVTAATAALLCAPTAFAQQGAQDDELRQERILVTLPGPDRSADELIGNATAITRDEIIDNLSSTLGDTLDRLPGVSSTYFGPGASRPVLRGLGVQRVLVLSNGIGVIDASAASPDHQVAVDGIDSQRIEILRGPAALAYGGQAIGGVVNAIDGLIVDEKPDEIFSGEAFVAYNTAFDGIEGGGRIQGVLGDFVITGSGSARDFEDVEIPAFALQDELLAILEAEGDEAAEDPAFGVLPNSFVDTANFAGGISWIGENAFFGVAGRRTTSVYGLPTEGPELFEEEEEEGEGEEGEEEEGEEAPFIDLDQTRIDFRGGLRFNDGPLTQITVSGSYADYEHTEFEAPGEEGTVFDNDGFEGRVEVEHSPFFGFEGAFGIQGRTQDFSAEGAEAFVTPTDTRFIGVFLYEAQEFDNGFGVEGGLRFDNTRVDNIFLDAQTFDTFAASVGAHQHVEPLGLFLGASFAFTERAPTDVELFSDGPHLATDQFEIGDPDLVRERGINIEGTARWSVGGLSIGANGFYTDFNDFIFLDPTGEVEDGLPVFIYLQEDARFVGGEVFGSYQTGDIGGLSLVFDASIDLVDAEFTDGDDVPFIPPLTFNGGVSAAYGAVTAGVEVTHATAQDEVSAGFLPTDAYTFVNLKADLDLSSFFGIGAEGTKLFVEARNVGDEEGRTATSVLRDTAPLPGRNIRFGARLAF